MNRYLIFFLFFALVACGDKSAPKIETDSPNLTSTPDVGKIEYVEVRSKGVGTTPGIAINEALKLAIQQVNGVIVDASSASLNALAKTTATLDIETSQGLDTAKISTNIQSQSFAERIITNSNGVVSTFSVLSSNMPSQNNGLFTVEIIAKIAKFKAPADSGKIKIVVTSLRSKSPTFNIGGNQVQAAEVLEPVRQLIIDSLSQSGRYTILDREFDKEIQSELGMVANGQSNSADLAKLGQALSADIVWVGVVNNLAYERRSRKLESADRELVSYGGSWAISQRLVNLTTRQIMLSNTLTGDFPNIPPTTMAVGINKVNTLKDIQANIARKATNAIMMKTFPISIVEIDGTNVALSQGEGSVREGQQFKIFLMGKEIKDPQTGQSLGNMESECCIVTINRVTPKMSYGTLSDIKIKLEGIKPGILQVREENMQSTDAISKSPNFSSTPNNLVSTRPKSVAAKSDAPKSDGKKDDDW